METGRTGVAVAAVVADVVWTLEINEVTCSFGETVVACPLETALAVVEAWGLGASEERGGSGVGWSSVEGDLDSD